MGGVLLLGASAAVTALFDASGPRAQTLPGESFTPTPLATATAVPATATPTPTPAPVRFPAPIDGVLLTAEEWEQRKGRSPIAVMVDNAPPAYPHAGLDRADLVYEAFVEGGITRFMAVFWRQDAEVISPVRSARTPFVIWASELGALYGHAGGADTFGDANAIGQIREWKVKDMDSFVRGSDVAYHRTADRYAPHNLVTSTAKLREAAAALGLDGPVALDPWRFKEDFAESQAAPKVGAIDIAFQSRRYASSVIQWHWDEATNTYARFQSGGPHLDEMTKQQLRFKTVIVMRVPFAVADGAGHVVYDQYGEGPASIFLDGRRIDGVWRKQDRAARTRFFDATGAEIGLNRGPVFIEVLGPESLVAVAGAPAGLPEIPKYEPPAAVPFQDPEPDPPRAPAPLPSSTASATASPGATRTPGAGVAPLPGTPGAAATGTVPSTAVAGATPAPVPSASSSPAPVPSASATQPASATQAPASPAPSPSPAP